MYLYPAIYIYIYNLHVVLCTVSLVAVADQATTNTATAIDHIHLPYKFILHTLYTRNFVDGNKFQRGCIYTIADKTKFFINYSLLFQLSFQLWRWMIIKTVSINMFCITLQKRNPSISDNDLCPMHYIIDIARIRFPELNVPTCFPHIYIYIKISLLITSPYMHHSYHINN